jgi:hypothetical protein
MARKKQAIGRPVGPDSVVVLHPRRRFKSGARIVSVTISTTNPKIKDTSGKPLHRPKHRPWRDDK